MKAREYKVGDIWGMVVGDSHPVYETGSSFEVAIVDSSGDAWTKDGYCVVKSRIGKGYVKLHSMVGGINATFAKDDLVAGKHVVETKCCSYYIVLADDVCIQLNDLTYPYTTEILGWDKAETLFSDLGVTKVYEIEQIKGGGFSFGGLKVVWSSEATEPKAKLAELEQKKLEIETEIAKLKEEYNNE